MKKSSNALRGQFLVGMPHLKDTRFAKSVIFLCEHDTLGAMGLVINHAFAGLTVHMVLRDLGLTIAPEVPDSPILQGGPLESGRGFVLHSSDYTEDATISFSEDLSITPTVSVLKMVAAGKGPGHSALILGHASWRAGQLDKEMAQNDWLSVPADPDVIFNLPIEKRWQQVWGQVGIDPAMLSNAVGHS